MKFLFPQNGDCITPADGSLGKSGITLRVSVDAKEDSEVFINGKKAVRCGNSFTCEADIRGYRTVLFAEDKRYKDSERIAVYFLPDSFGKYRISSDDNILFLQDITDNTEKYKSIFENPYLALYKEAHDLYGAKAHINLFYEFVPEEAAFSDNSRRYFNLSMMTDKFKAEFQANSDWLKLAFHAKSEFPDKPYLHASGDTIRDDAVLIMKEIVRFAGKECISDSTTVHWGEANRDCVRALRNLGFTSLTGYFERNPDGSPLVAYYTDGELTDRIGSRDFFYDESEDMMFGRIDLVLNLNSYEWVMSTLKEVTLDPHRSPFVEIMIHEQYFYPDYSGYLPDFSHRLLDSCRLLHSLGYRGGHISEVIGEKHLNENLDIL